MLSTKDTRLILALCLSAVLASVTVGCSVGAHSAASHPAHPSRSAPASAPSAASSPVYLAQVTCWNTMSCCIQRWPLSAAQSCGASAAEIAEVLNGARLLYAVSHTEEGRLEEGAREHTDAADSEAEASDEPPNCKGQNHHVISRPISEELKQHVTLRGLYKPRDERFVAKAKDKESHCGYQQWHRDVDKEVIKWLKEFPRATWKKFERFLREIYNRPEMLKRFPNGY